MSALNVLKYHLGSRRSRVHFSFLSFTWPLFLTKPGQWTCPPSHLSAAPGQNLPWPAGKCAAKAINHPRIPIPYPSYSVSRSETEVTLERDTLSMYSGGSAHKHSAPSLCILRCLSLPSCPCLPLSLVPTLTSCLLVSHLSASGPTGNVGIPLGAQSLTVTSGRFSVGQLLSNHNAGNG